MRLTNAKRTTHARHLIGITFLELMMFVTRTRAARAALLATLGGATLALSAATRGVTPAFGGPWISIEAPANPYDQTTHGAVLLVHTFHHGAKVDLPLVGKAEGLVDGERKSVALTLAKSSQVGTRSVRNEWGKKGIWTVVLTASEGQASIQAVAEMNADGSVGRISVPSKNGRPHLLSVAEIDQGLRDRARVPMAVGGR
jgi:hypothetical protein